MTIITGVHDVNGATEVGDIVTSGGELVVTTLGEIQGTTVFAGGEDIVGGPNQSAAVSLDTTLSGAGFMGQPSGIAEEVVLFGGTAVRLARPSMPTLFR